MARDFTQLTEYVERFKSFALWMQVDVKDGIFAPNPSWPLCPGQEADVERMLSGEMRLPEGMSYEAHLMIESPLRVGEAFARAGCTRLIPHIEAFASSKDIEDTFASWQKAGAKEVGLAILLDTPLSALSEAARLCDVIQVMSISDVGHQGRPFDERALSRVEELHALYPDMMVAVDGGVTEATVEELVRAGANRLAVGRILMQSSEPEVTFADIHERAMRGCTPITLQEAV